MRIAKGNCGGSDSDPLDLVIIGCGAAGLTAAVAALEYGAESGSDLRIAVIERTAKGDRGGNTRWTSAYMRMNAAKQLPPDFEDDLIRFSQGHVNVEYLRRLMEDAPKAFQWLEGYGVRLEERTTYFINQSQPRLAIAGGGLSLIEQLTEAAEAGGISFRYNTRAISLLREDAGVVGVELEGGGHRERLFARSVLLACGGFEGDAELRSRYFGASASDWPTVARGGLANCGEGITMAIAAGAATSGEWENFHCEPVDPRSRLPEALVMVYPYGILVNESGNRFVDEGAATVDEGYENVARAVSRQEGNIAYLITDSKLQEIPNYERALLTDRRPYSASAIAQLGEKIGIDPVALSETVTTYNSAATGRADSFDWHRRDALATERWYAPRKSNWARRLDSPPYLAWPIKCAIVFSFGGLDTDMDGRVLDARHHAIRGLFAAGEIHGFYWHKYAGATSVMRAIVFGRRAGRAAICAALAELDTES